MFMFLYCVLLLKGEIRCDLIRSFSLSLPTRARKFDTTERTLTVRGIRKRNCWLLVHYLIVSFKVIYTVSNFLVLFHSDSTQKKQVKDFWSLFSLTVCEIQTSQDYILNEQFFGKQLRHGNRFVCIIMWFVVIICFLELPDAIQSI